MFVFQNMEKPRLDIPGLMLTENGPENKTAKFDLNLEATEENGKLMFSLEYRTALFKEETARRLGGYYKNIIHAVIENPGTGLANIEIMDPMEKEKILAIANGPMEPIDLNETIHGWFEKRATAQPNKTALVFGDGRLTYGELNRGARRLARSLRGSGFDPGSIAGLMMERSLHMVTAMLAVLNAGGAYYHRPQASGSAKTVYDRREPYDCAAGKLRHTPGDGLQYPGHRFKANICIRPGWR